MAHQAGYSPSFKLPAEIMRMRRKRARSDSSGATLSAKDPSPGGSAAATRPFSPGPLFKDQNHCRAGIKRRNPFATIENTYSPRKKLFVYDEMDGGNVGPSRTEWTEKDGNEDKTTTGLDGSACREVR